MAEHNLLVAVCSDPRFDKGWWVDCCCGHFMSWVAFDRLESHIKGHLDRAARDPALFAARPWLMSADHELSDAALLADIINYDPEQDPTDLLSRAYNRIEAIYG